MSGPKKPNNKTKAKGCDILHITTKLINTLYALAVETIIIMCTFHKGPVDMPRKETLHLNIYFAKHRTVVCCKEYGYECPGK